MDFLIWYFNREKITSYHISYPFFFFFVKESFRIKKTIYNGKSEMLF